MPHTREEIATNVAARWCWQVARGDDSRVARRLSRQQVVDGVERLDEGAWRADFFDVLPELGVRDGLGDIQGTASQRVRGPFVHQLRLYRLKTLLGIESIAALAGLAVP